LVILLSAIREVGQTDENPREARQDNLERVMPPMESAMRILAVRRMGFAPHATPLYFSAASDLRQA
jgi:hypothetical protein